MNYNILIILLSVSCVNICWGSNEIPCPLVWAPLVKGDRVPSNAISTTTNGREIIVSRASYEGQDYGGYYSDLDGFTHAVKQGGSRRFDEFEVLTNPHGCITQWLTGLSDLITWPNTVTFGNTLEKPVGRGWADNTFISGAVIGTTLYVKSGSSSLFPITNYEVLRSFSEGLTLKIDSFTFDKNPFEASPDFVGIDEIYNGAATHVKQIVTQSKTVRESSTISTSKFWGVTGKFSASIKPEIEVGNIKISLGEVELADEISYSSSNNKTIHKEKETTISITKEVLVAPYSSVQICSTISIAENFKAEYTARGIYTAPGLDSNQVAKILEEDGKFGEKDGKGGVVTVEKGEFGGSLSVTTQFIVVPQESDNGGGCTQLSMKIQQLKRGKRLKTMNEGEVKERITEINNFILAINKRK